MKQSKANSSKLYHPYFNHHYNTNPNRNQCLFLWITLGRRRLFPGPCGTSPGSLDQNKTAVNKGVWEFRELRHARDAAAPAFTDAAEDNHPGSLWSFNPTNS